MNSPDKPEGKPEGGLNMKGGKLCGLNGGMKGGEEKGRDEEREDGEDMDIEGMPDEERDKEERPVELREPKGEDDDRDVSIPSPEAGGRKKFGMGLLQRG